MASTNMSYRAVCSLKHASPVRNAASLAKSIPWPTRVTKKKRPAAKEEALSLVRMSGLELKIRPWLLRAGESRPDRAEHLCRGHKILDTMSYYVFPQG